MVLRLILALFSLCCWILVGSVANAQLITQPPVSTTAALGTNATFSCRGTGSVLWRINGTQVRDPLQLPAFENVQVYVPLPRDSSSELIVTATEVTNATLVIICVVDPGIEMGDPGLSDAVRLLVYGEPNPPHDISVDADGLTLVASWDEPFSLEGEELSYAVSITNTATGVQREVNVTTTRYVLHEPIGERDCAEYKFTVFSKNNYSKSRNGVTGRDHIPTEPLIIRASDVKIDVSFTSGISATIDFNSADPCTSYPVMSYAFNITDRFTNSLITNIRHKNNRSLLPLTLNGNDGIVPNQAYDLIIEAKNGVGRTPSEKIPFNTTGLQSFNAVVELNDSITITCIFATGASSTGCQVTIFMMDNFEEVFSTNISRRNGDTQVVVTFSLQGLKKNNTLLHVQTVELLSGGGVSNVMFNSTVSVTGIFSTTTTTTHVPETSSPITTLSSERSQVPIVDTLQYIIIGVVMGAFVLILLVLIVIITYILVSLKRRRKSQDISSQGATSNSYESSVYPAYETIRDRAGVSRDTLEALHNPVYNGIVVHSGSDIPVNTYPIYAEIGQMTSNVHGQRNHTIGVLSTGTAAPLSPSSETGPFVSQVPSPYLVPQRSPGAVRAKTSNQPLPCTEPVSHEPLDSLSTNSQSASTNQRLSRDTAPPYTSHQRNTGLVSDDCEGAGPSNLSGSNQVCCLESQPPPVYESIKTTSSQHPRAPAKRINSSMQLQTNSIDT